MATVLRHTLAKLVRPLEELLLPTHLAGVEGVLHDALSLWRLPIGSLPRFVGTVKPWLVA